LDVLTKVINSQILRPDITYHEEVKYLKERERLFEDLYKMTNWQDEYIYMFGKKVKCPRKVSWYGDAGVIYRYSGNTHKALGFYPILAKIKDHTEKFLNKQFNFALLNYYHNQDDYMGWHSDNEKELGINPVIASISLGSSRVMKFKHKREKLNYNIKLQDSSLLVMQGDTQENWLHTIPKVSNLKGPRINITFRFIFS